MCWLFHVGTEFFFFKTLDHFFCQALVVYIDVVYGLICYHWLHVSFAVLFVVVIWSFIELWIIPHKNTHPLIIHLVFLFPY